MNTFLFYDIETSGLNPAFDQILTFASIRTDLRLNEIEKQSITIRLREDIVPSPKAFLTHGLTFKELEQGICEYEAAKIIHHEVNRPGTISLGYNSLGFDDVFLRFFFYRNLFDPYSHQYSQGCSRMDMLPITVLYRLFNPSRLKWPVNADQSEGDKPEAKPSLKLELISKENAFITSGRAHEAMADVEAVIAVGKSFIKDKKIWEYTTNFFNKAKEDIRINNIKEDFLVQNRHFRICLMLSASFGPDQNYMIPVIHLGRSNVYKNQSLWLRLDSDDVIGLNGGLDVSETNVIRKKNADAYIILPALDRFWRRLPEVSKHLSNENYKVIQQNGQRLFQLIQYHSEFKYPFVPDLDLDAALYQDGFFNVKEKKDIRKLHQAINNTNFDILDGLKSHRIQKLGQRILLRNFNDNLPSGAQNDFYCYLERLKSTKVEDQILGYKNDAKYNLKNASDELLEIESSLSNQNEEQEKMMAWLKSYLEEL